jgi:hypothetical protein
MKTYGHKFLCFNFLQEFRTSTQPLPQPFCLNIKAFLDENLDIAQSEEQNPQTGETLTIWPHRK